MDYKIFFEDYRSHKKPSLYFKDYSVRDILGLTYGELSKAVQEGKLIEIRTKGNGSMYPKSSVLEYMRKYGLERTDIMKLPPNDCVSLLTLMRCVGKSKSVIKNAYRKLPRLVKKTEKGVKWFWRVSDLQNCDIVKQWCEEKSAEPQQQTLLNTALEDQRILYKRIKISGGAIVLSGKKEIKLYNVKQSLANKVDAKLMIEVLREKQAVLVLWEYFDRVLEEAEAPKELTLTF